MLTLAGVRLAAPACPAKPKLTGFTVSKAIAGLTVTVAETLLLISAWLVAVTVTEVGNTVGAVNEPDELIVPAVVRHETARFEVLLTVAMNC